MNSNCSYVDAVFKINALKFTYWIRHWDNLITIFDYPMQIRKAIYTTNTIVSLNSVNRKTIKKRKQLLNG